MILEEFPKSTVDVYVCVLEAAGGELPAAVCAASLALADAGIAMRDLVAACSVVRPGPPKPQHPHAMLSEAAYYETRDNVLLSSVLFNTQQALDTLIKLLEEL